MRDPQQYLTFPSFCVSCLLSSLPPVALDLSCNAHCSLRHSRRRAQSFKRQALVPTSFQRPLSRIRMPWTPAVSVLGPVSSFSSSLLHFICEIQSIIALPARRFSPLNTIILPMPRHFEQKISRQNIISLHSSIELGLDILSNILGFYAGIISISLSIPRTKIQGKFDEVECY